MENYRALKGSAQEETCSAYGACDPQRPVFTILPQTVSTMDWTGGKIREDATKSCFQILWSHTVFLVNAIFRFHLKKRFFHFKNTDLVRSIHFSNKKTEIQRDEGAPEVGTARLRARKTEAPRWWLPVPSPLHPHTPQGPLRKNEQTGCPLMDGLIS